MAWRLDGSILTHVQQNAKLDLSKSSDYEYVLDCQLNTDETRVAMALSTRQIQIRDSESLQVLTTLTGHTTTINELHPSSMIPHRIFSCSSDHTVKCWDIRTHSSSSAALSLSVEAPAWSVGVSCNDTLVAVGSNNAVYFYDLRTGSKLGVYDESHLDAVTRVKFHPLQQTQLVTASEDGLVCVFDCNVAEEEEALLSILNVESAVSKFQFFGSKLDSIACVTCTETLDVWNFQTATRRVHFPTFRQFCVETLGKPVDYLIDCHYDQRKDQLQIVAGNHQGTIEILGLSNLASNLIPIQTLTAGHKSDVRCMCVGKNATLFTGGEDARLCRWSFGHHQTPLASSSSSAARTGTMRYRPY